MSEEPRTDGRRLPFIIATTVVAVIAAIVAAIAINNANTSTPVGAVTPPPGPTAPPTAPPTISPVPVPGTPCSSASFGAVLQPLNAPSDPHVYAAAPPTTINAAKLYLVTLHTTRGDVQLCLEPKIAPVTVNVIVTLVRNHYYDGIPFHRIGPGAQTPPVVQVGDPNCIGNVSATTCGQGGPGFKFNDEPVQGNYVTGTVAMANAGPNTNGSQFFINKADDSALKQSGNYNLFGVVSSGMNVVQAIQVGDVITSATVQQQS